MLDDKAGLLGVNNETLDDLAHNNTLLGIEVSRRLINKVNIGRTTKTKDKSHSLKFTTRQVLELLIQDSLNGQRLDDIRVELRMQEGGTDLGIEESTNTTLKLGADFLGLVRDRQTRKLHMLSSLLFIALQETSEHTNKGGLTSTVLTEQHHDLSIREGTLLDMKSELMASTLEGLGHRRIFVCVILLANLIRGLSELKVELLFSESQVLRRDKTSQEDVDTITNVEGHGHHTISTRSTVEAANEIREVIEDRKIVLDADDVEAFLVLEDITDDLGSLQTLLDIEVGGGLIEHVHIGLSDGDKSNSETLKLTTRELVEVTLHQVSQLQLLGNLIEVATLVLGLKDLAHLQGGERGREGILDREWHGGWNRRIGAWSWP